MLSEIQHPVQPQIEFPTVPTNVFATKESDRLIGDQLIASP